MILSLVELMLKIFQELFSVLDLDLPILSFHFLGFKPLEGS